VIAALRARRARPSVFREDRSGRLVKVNRMRQAVTLKGITAMFVLF
jgi:hypothetical protein